MNSQYCKVGAVTPITVGEQALSVLELRYRSFMEMAARTAAVDARLREFFTKKAKQIKKVLDDLA